MRRCIFLLLCIVLVSCSNPEPLSVALLLNLSGVNSDVGVAVRDVAIMQFRKWNKEGGINGRIISYTTFDHQADHEKAAKLTREICEQDYDIIFGPALSSVAEDIVSVANEFNIPVLSPTASLNSLTGKKDVFLRTVGLASAQGKRLVRFMQERSFVHPILIYDPVNTVFAEAILNEVLSTYDQIPIFAIEHENVLSRIEQIRKTEDVDMVGLITASPTAALIVQQMKSFDRNITFIGSSWVKSGDLIELGGAAIDGMYIVTTPERGDPSDLRLRFEEEFEAAFLSNPGMVHSLTYDATEMLFYALKDIFSHNLEVNPENLIQGFRKIGTYQGVDESIEIDEFGDGMREMTLQVIQNGQFKRVDE